MVGVLSKAIEGWARMEYKESRAHWGFFARCARLLVIMIKRTHIVLFFRIPSSSTRR
jgi:hypothetical protein